MNRLLCGVLCAVCVGLMTTASRGADTKKGGDWLLTKADIKYAGAFKLPKGKGGKGRNCIFAYSPGAIAYDIDRNSFYVAGHGYFRGVAEVSNPGLMNTTDVSKLPRAKYVQNFRKLIANLPSGNPDNLNVLGGAYVERVTIERT